MTKENSTKPAFVSKETGRGDGFLAAPHVWESSAFPPWAAAAAAAAAARWNAAARRTGDRARMEITALFRKWWTEELFVRSRNKLHSEMTFSIYRQTEHRVPFIEGLFHISTPVQKSSSNIQRMNSQEFSLSVSFMWLTPAYVCSPVSDLALLLPFDPRTRWWGLFWSPLCPERAVRVWPSPSVWPH